MKIRRDVRINKSLKNTHACVRLLERIKKRLTEHKPDLQKKDPRCSAGLYVYTVIMSQVKARNNLESRMDLIRARFTGGPTLISR